MDTGSHEVAPGAAAALDVAKESTPCPSCGYDVTGVTSDRCPECGYIIVNGGLGDPARYEPFLGRGQGQVLVSILLLGAVSLSGCLFTRGLLLILLGPVYLAFVLGIAARKGNHGRWRGASYILWWRLMWPLLMPCALLAAGAIVSVVLGFAFPRSWMFYTSVVEILVLYLTGMCLCISRAARWAVRWRLLARRAGFPPVVGSRERSARGAAWLLAAISMFLATVPLFLALAAWTSLP